MFKSIHDRVLIYNRVTFKGEKEVKEVMIGQNNAEELEIKLSGEIDSGNADAFYAEVCGAFDSEPKNIHFSCNELTFIDSTTLGAFVKLNKYVTAQGKKIRLSGLQPKIRKLFAICVLDRVMEIDE